MSEPSVQERIALLRHENQTLAATNTSVLADNAALHLALDARDHTVHTMQSVFDTALVAMEARFKDLLALQATETRDIIDAAHADIRAILDQHDHALTALTTLQRQYDAVKTAYNQYRKSHP